MAEDASQERGQLLFFLTHQRDSVLAIVDDLAEEHWHTRPSGWTVAGMIEHLGGAERHWIQRVINGHEIDLPWNEGRPEYDPNAPLVRDRPPVRRRITSRVTACHERWLASARE
jgi:hypothetical protein